MPETVVHFQIRMPPVLHEQLASWAKEDKASLNALIVEETHTCYLGVRGARHPWGHGCGECPACKLRAAGWAEFSASGHARRGG